METKGKLVVGALLGVYAAAGVATGWLFGKAQYYKGRIDSANEIRDGIQKIAEEFERKLEEKREAE